MNISHIPPHKKIIFIKKNFFSHSLKEKYSLNHYLQLNAWLGPVLVQPSSWDGEQRAFIVQVPKTPYLESGNNWLKNHSIITACLDSNCFQGKQMGVASLPTPLLHVHHAEIVLVVARPSQCWGHIQASLWSTHHPKHPQWTLPDWW